MTARIYDFALPYTLTGLADMVGVNELQSAGLWDDIPADLQVRMVAGEGLFGNGAVVTQQELDRLPDKAWKYIAAQLSLSWHEEA